MRKSAGIIVALDVEDFTQAKRLAEQLSTDVAMFKVGLQLFTACGPRVVEYILAKRGKVFLDLKLHDIPNTVAQAVRQAVRLRVSMMTLHIQGGEEMLRAAVAMAKREAAARKIKKPYLVGVTVLTSQKASIDEVIALSRLGLNCGLDGVVCSAQEAAALRRRIKKDFLIVTPGIRSLAADAADQRRVTTPRQAVEAGSDYLVIGRPIIEARNPIAAVHAILQEIRD